MNTRRYPRYEANIPLVATLIGDREVCTVRGQGRVISEGGLGAAMSYAIPIGHVVSLELHLANLTETLRIRAVCRNCRCEQCGFEFVALSGREHEFIARYCRMQARWLVLKGLVCGKGA